MPKRCRLSIQEDKKGRSLAWLLFSTFVAELIGTAILILIGCMGEAYGFPTLHTSDMQGGFVFGITVLALIQVFGPVSGCHINPAVTLAEWILGLISLPLAGLYFVAQIIGAIAGTGFLKLITSDEVMDATGARTNGTFCVVSPSNSLTVTQGFFAEFFCTFLLLLFCVGCWDERNSKKLDSMEVKFALVIAGLSMAGGPYAGASMNPARAFGPAVIFNKWDSHWIYWVAPIAAAIIVPLLGIFLIEEKGQRQRSDRESGADLTSNEAR